MKRVMVTFSVSYGQGQSTGLFMENVQMTNEQYDAFNMDQIHGGHALARWIENNLSYKYLTLIDASRGYSIKDPGVQSN